MEKRRHIALFSLRYWHQTLSLAWSRFNRQGRALILLRKAQENLRRGRILQAIPFALAGGMIGPEVAFYTAFYPRMRDFTKRVLLIMLDRWVRMRGIFPQTAAYLEYTDSWSDGWVGPRLRVSREAGPEVRLLRVEGWVDLGHIKGPFVLTASVDGQEIGQKVIKESGHFTLELLPLQPVAQGIHGVEVKASAWFVPHRFLGNGDYRPLSFRMEEIRFC
jgi:hypothetical protein